MKEIHYMEFYYLQDSADLLHDHYPDCYGDGNMREDNIEEWMHLCFEKTIKFNEKNNSSQKA